MNPPHRIHHRQTSHILMPAILWAMVLSGGAAKGESIDLGLWNAQFERHYDYVLAESAGLARSHEPVEVTLTLPGGNPDAWRDTIRIARLLPETESGQLIPHDVLGMADASAATHPEGEGPHPVSSVNVVFLAKCPAHATVVYRLYWGWKGAEPPAAAVEAGGLSLSGEAPGLHIDNGHYSIQLDPKSGAIRTIRTAGGADGTEMSYKTLPIHFGTDVWSPKQGWDHDYDWLAPPNQRVEGGATALRYHRWGPLQHYTDVQVSIVYTFYAHVPYVHVSSTLTFTQNRSVHAVRMGEIVVSHSRKPGVETGGEGDEADPEVFSHFAWPGAGDGVITREINAHRGDDGRANLEGIAPGALGILDRDVGWVAGYNADKNFGLASLRRMQYAGNTLGGPVPHSAPCTYVANYGWGFVYWSRPMVYPLGERETDLDCNTAVAAGTLFATDEALLLFKPGEDLREVRQTHLGFTKPLQLRFKGTGPW